MCFVRYGYSNPGPTKLERGLESYATEVDTKALLLQLVIYNTE